MSSALGSPLRLRVFIAGRNRLENEGASALAKAFQVVLCVFMLIHKITL